MYPTMKEILTLEEMKGLTILAGEDGLGRHASCVTIMDSAEIVYWMEEFEILLTNGYFLKDYSEAQLIEFLDSLIRKKSAGVFIKVSKHLKTIPAEVLFFADQHGFLLVEIPNHFSWTDITEPINRYINQIQFYFVHQAMDFRDELMSLSLTGGSVVEMCNLAASSLKKPVAIYKKDFKLWAASSHFHIHLLSSSLRMRMKYRHTLPVEEVIKFENYSIVIEGIKFCLFPIVHGADELGSLVLEIQENEQMKYSDVTKIDQFMMLVTYELSKARELARIEKRYYSEFINNMLEGDVVDKKIIMEHGLNLGKDVFEEYVVCLVEKKGKMTLEKQFDAIDKAIGNPSLMNKCLYTEKNEHFVFLIPWNQGLSFEVLKKAMQRLDKRKPHLIGISSVTSVTELKKGYQEALFAYSCHNIFTDTCIFYEETGILPLLVTDQNKLNRPFIEAYMEKNIQPITSYDEQNGTNLLGTLLSLVRYNFNISQTASQLFVHENTLRYRVKRIEKLTQKDFKKSEDIFQVILGCYIYLVEQNQIDTGRLQ